LPPKKLSTPYKHPKPKGRTNPKAAEKGRGEHSPIPTPLTLKNPNINQT
jgi:hypothetical protein